MARGSNRAFVRLSPRKPHKQWIKVTKRFIKDYKSIVKKVKTKGLKIMRSNVPVSTGRLRDSFTSRSTVSSRLKAVVFVESDVPYLRFVDQGAGPSPGRYVPALDRRIRTGIHPGQQGRRFMDETRREMQTLVNRELKGLISKTDKSVSRLFPRRKRGARVRG